LIYFNILYQSHFTNEITKTDLAFNGLASYYILNHYTSTFGVDDVGNEVGKGRVDTSFVMVTSSFTITEVNAHDGSNIPHFAVITYS
jgi:hypothetical protein